MLTSLVCLSRRLEAELELVQQFANLLSSYAVSHGVERNGQFPHALGRPPQSRHRVAPRRGIHQLLQVRQQRRLFVCQTFASGPRASDLSPRTGLLLVRQPAALQLLELLFPTQLLSGCEAKCCRFPWMVNGVKSEIERASISGNRRLTRRVPASAVVCLFAVLYAGLRTCPSGSRR